MNTFEPKVADYKGGRPEVVHTVPYLYGSDGRLREAALQLVGCG